jgi:hypothetical protein
VAHALETLDSIEHLSGYPLPAPQTLIDATRESGVWNCPTLYVYTAHVTSGMPAEQREQLLAQRRALVTALDAAGARILAGTDAGYLVPAGTSLTKNWPSSPPLASPTKRSSPLLRNRPASTSAIRRSA